ncbi:hypothetical protein GCWU000342_01806 [Shuttleworthella satelles DSM 14600]|uniref:Uncharacterized protein n=1 Tax=Shuttleworthella satelles DSM 14600 TaxID=626523 RepID=C4GCW3_9FIRM|nr:hypothetical protein GCWU000342_01806 [Shuttleworthia satelles DSM 14600]
MNHCIFSPILPFLRLCPLCHPSSSSLLCLERPVHKLHQRSRSSPTSTIPLTYAIRQPSRMRH